MKRIATLATLLLLLAAPAITFAAHPAPAPVETSMPLSDAIRQRLQSMRSGERNELRQSIRSEIRHFKKARKAGSEADVSTLLLTLIALILPPLAVFLHQGVINSKFWISLLLTLLVWIPGVVYALLVIFGVVQ